MELFHEQLDLLYHLNKDWVAIINKYYENDYEEGVNPNNLSDEEMYSLLEEFHHLMDICKPEFQKNTTDLINDIEHQMSPDDSNDFKKLISRLFRVFIISAPLRNMQNKNEEDVKSLLQYLFNNFVIRFNPKFHQKNMDYRIKSEDRFKELAHMLDHITEFYLSRHYTTDAITEDFMDETGLNRSISQYYANLIEKNYLSMQLNLIIDNTAL